MIDFFISVSLFVFSCNCAASFLPFRLCGPRGLVSSSSLFFILSGYHLLGSQSGLKARKLRNMKDGKQKKRNNKKNNKQKKAAEDGATSSSSLTNSQQQDSNAPDLNHPIKSNENHSVPESHSNVISDYPAENNGSDSIDSINVLNPSNSIEGICCQF